MVSLTPGIIFGDGFVQLVDGNEYSMDAGNAHPKP